MLNNSDKKQWCKRRKDKMEHFNFPLTLRTVKFQHDIQTHKLDFRLPIQTFTILLTQSSQFLHWQRHVLDLSTQTERSETRVQTPYKPFHCDSFYGLGLRKENVHKKSKTLKETRIYEWIFILFSWRTNKCKYTFKVKMALVVCRDHWGKHLASWLQDKRGSADSISQSMRPRPPPPFPHA